MKNNIPRHYKIASWISKKFPTLKENQALTTFFDSLLVANTCLFHYKIYVDSKKFIAELKKIKGVSTSKHKFGGIQFDVDEKEICHIHGNGIIDILWPQLEQKRFLVEHGYCDVHHVQPKSKWTTFYLNGSNLQEALKYANLHYKVITTGKNFMDDSQNLTQSSNGRRR